MKWIRIEAEAAVTKIPFIGVDLTGRTVGKLYGQWCVTGILLGYKVCNRRWDLTILYDDRHALAVSTTGATGFENDVVLADFGKRVLRVALVTGDAVTKVPVERIDLASAGLVGEAHSQRGAAAGDIGGEVRNRRICRLDVDGGANVGLTTRAAGCQPNLIGPCLTIGVNRVGFAAGAAISEVPTVACDISTGAIGECDYQRCFSGIR